jgi:hypothetical protein
MSIEVAKIHDRQQLFAILADVNISVPGRSEGRMTAHAETWTICRLLATLAEAHRLVFPVTLTHRDRPNFLLSAGGVRIGIEVTEAIWPQYAAYCALAEREFPDVWLEPVHFRWGAPELTTSEMRDLLRQSQLTSEGWSGESAEEEWAQFMLSVLDTKLAKLANPGFDRYEQSWLAIYDNLPLPNIHLSSAVGKLRVLIIDRWVFSPSFGAIYVEHGPVIAEITREAAMHYVLRDLWQ